MLAECIAPLGYRVAALFDNRAILGSPLPGVRVYRGWEGFEDWRRAHRGRQKFLVAIGGDRGTDRLEIHDRLEAAGLTPMQAIHQTAFVATNATLGPGSHVLANSTVGVEARIGKQCIINTNASVRLNVFDLEYIWSPNIGAYPAGMTYSGGLRFADIHQSFRAQITGGGSTLSDGVFQVGFFGVGPYGSLTGRLWVDEGRTLSLFAKAGGALLVGKNHITAETFTSAASPGNVLGSFTAGQDAGRILVAPVLESELGVSWVPTNWLTVSADQSFRKSGCRQRPPSGQSFIAARSTPLPQGRARDGRPR